MSAAPARKPFHAVELTLPVVPRHRTARDGKPTRVTIDGREVRGVRGVKVEAGWDRATEVTLTFLADVQVHAAAELIAESEQGLKPHAVIVDELAQSKPQSPAADAFDHGAGRQPTPDPVTPPREARPMRDGVFDHGAGYQPSAAPGDVKPPPRVP